MYYEEAVINGILCHRGTPDGEWIPFTAEQLTERIQQIKQKYEALKAAARAVLEQHSDNTTSLYELASLLDGDK